MVSRVLISDKLSDTAVEIFRDRGLDVTFEPDLGKDKDKLAKVINEFDGLAVRSATKVTEKIIRDADRLRVVGRAGIGIDNIDIKAATAKGVIVMNTPFGNSITTAEHAISLMLALARQIPAADTSTQQGKWEKARFMGVEITGKVLGIIGCGNIGSIVAARALGLCDSRAVVRTRRRTMISVTRMRHFQPMTGGGRTRRPRSSSASR